MFVLLDKILFFAAAIILLASIVLSFKTRFVQIRMIPELIRQLIACVGPKKSSDDTHTIEAHKALFTAMSTTLGLSTIVGPVVAMFLGGPGALLGFLVTTFFAPAANYVEVTLALYYRKRLPDGSIMGGPMQYLKAGISEWLAKWYAFVCLLMMVAWSSAQANQLASVLNMPMLGKWAIPPLVTASVLAVTTLVILLGGIKRVGEISAKLVPTMFVLFVGGAGWIVISNAARIPEVLRQVIASAAAPHALSSGIIVGGIVQSLRWGVFKGLQSSEAGIGTQTIPHSMSETKCPRNQGILSMAATYSAGLISILSGLVILLSGTLEDNTLPLGISMVVEAFRQSYLHAGTLIVMLSTLLFAFGTILGNSYNGGECFRFLSKNRYIKIYYVFTIVGIFIGSVCDVSIIWTMTDFFLAPLAVSHIVAIVYLAWKREDILNGSLP